ncbi:AraC family transcriptional regulator [Rugamonas sp.]|uniref:AraC family transcriptional regulator n=1 Tax=Rugamonas sp. TaxID=1926287 RepID=UPI0025DEE17D|nr:AraC family transcriptional regulator [Rugamonas sp.]
MDALSRLLTLYPLRTALDVRCQFGAPWLLSHDGSDGGIAPYHVVVRGGARVDVGAERGLALVVGDIVVFPHGTAHRLYINDGDDGDGSDGGGADIGRALPLRAVPGDHVLPQMSNHGPGAATDVLCGEFRFESDAIAGLLAALPPVLIVHTADRPEAAGLHHLLAMLQLETDAGETPRPGASAIVSQLSSALFALLIRAWLEQSTPVAGLFAVLAQRRLQAALHGMLESPERPWSLEQMAEVCHMSRATFARLFKQAAGATPAEVLLQIRMAQAARRLSQGRQGAGGIAEAVGYQSEAAFSRVFKRHYGVGPGEYRRRALQNTGA